MLPRLALSYLGLLLASVHACTLMAVGSKATVDGSVLVSHTNDGTAHPYDLRLVRVPAMTHAPGSKRAVYNYLDRRGYPRLVTNERGPAYMPVNDTNQTLNKPNGYIPQVPKTYAYWDSYFGMQNEVQLSIGETTTAAKTVGYPVDLPYGKNLFDIQELSKVALERCDTAVCAVKTMGELAETYGFYGDYSEDPLVPDNAGSGEALAIGDKYGNVWIFHILTGPHNSGAVWAAQRVGDDQVVIVPNTFVIRELNLTDSKNFLASSNVKEFAYSKGWASPDKPFDFTSAYAYAPPSPSKPLYGGRRMWRAYDMLAPNLHLDPALGFQARVPTYPFSVQPMTPITALTLMRIMSDYYQGTPFDLTQGVAAGPFHDPARFSSRAKNATGNWERSISIHRATHSFVLQARQSVPDHIGGLAWYGQGVPADTVYFPIGCRQNTLPAVFNSALRTRFDFNSTWWAFHFTSNWAHIQYSYIHREIQAERVKYRTEAFALQQANEAACTQLKEEACAALIETKYNDFIVNTTKAWWEFAWHLVSSYTDGYHFYNETAIGGRGISYDGRWANETSYIRYPDEYYPPAQVALEEAAANATDPDIGYTLNATKTILTQSSSVQSDVLSLPSGFLLGFVCGAMALSLVMATAVLVLNAREVKTAKSTTESSASKQEIVQASQASAV
ncbi:unnamed protein product [Aphanomyces euteiches]